MVSSHLFMHAAMLMIICFVVVHSKECIRAAALPIELQCLGQVSFLPLSLVSDHLFKQNTVVVLFLYLRRIDEIRLGQGWQELLNIAAEEVHNSSSLSFFSLYIKLSAILCQSSSLHIYISLCQNVDLSVCDCKTRASSQLAMKESKANIGTHLTPSSITVECILTLTIKQSRIYQFAKLHLYGPYSSVATCPLAMTDGAARLSELLLKGQEDDSGISKCSHNILNPFSIFTKPVYNFVMCQGTPYSLHDLYKHFLSRDPKAFWTSGQWMTER